MTEAKTDFCSQFWVFGANECCNHYPTIEGHQEIGISNTTLVQATGSDSVFKSTISIAGALQC
jgi:hypothetical protein